MLDKERVNKQIVEIAASYTNGMITKLEALEAMIAVVDTEITNYRLERKDTVDNLTSDYAKAARILRIERRISSFKDNVSFGDIVNQ